MLEPYTFEIIFSLLFALFSIAALGIMWYWYLIKKENKY
jgi:hypothetical protein